MFDARNPRHTAFIQRWRQAQQGGGDINALVDEGTQLFGSPAEITRALGLGPEGDMPVMEVAPSPPQPPQPAFGEEFMGGGGLLADARTPGINPDGQVPQAPDAQFYRDTQQGQGLLGAEPERPDFFGRMWTALQDRPGAFQLIANGLGSIATGDPRYAESAQQQALAQDRLRAERWAQSQAEQQRAKVQADQEAYIRSLPPEEQLAARAAGGGVYAGEAVKARFREKKPESLSDLGKLLAEQARWGPETATYNAYEKAIQKKVAGDGAQGTMDKAALLERELGISRQQAVKVAAGVYRVSRDPDTNQVDLIDLTTGQTVSPGGGRQPSLSERPPPETPATAKGKIDLDNAYGFGASINEYIGDTVGQVAPGVVDQDVVQARTAIRLAQGDFMRAMAKNPRLPVYEQERLAEIFREPTAWKSAESARRMIGTVREEIGAYRAEAEQIANDPGANRQHRAEAQEALRNFSQLEAILGRFATESEAPAPLGVARPETAAEYEALPTGARFLDAEGRIRVKGGQR